MSLIWGLRGIIMEKLGFKRKHFIGLGIGAAAGFGMYFVGSGVGGGGG